MIELEHYILEEEIGRGDMATVYRGRHKTDDTLVAIKLIGPQFTFDAKFVQRFKDAVKQAIRLEHPSIVRTYEAIQEGDRLYIVRELIEGRPLAELIEEEGPLSPQRMLVIARQIASALDYAHQHSVTHGDLSANLIYIGLNDHAMIADFGQTQAMSGTSLAKQGYAVGTPETMAPERVHGQGPTRQADLYSLGIICYQMLAGELPFTGSPAAVLHAQAYEQPTALHIVNPTISPALSEAIDRMLAKGLELRYNTGSEFSRALAVAIEGVAPIRSSSQGGAALQPAPTQRRWLWLLAIIPVLLILLALGFGAVSLWSMLRFTSEPAVAVASPTSPPTFTLTPAIDQAAPATATAEPSSPTLAPLTATVPPSLSPTPTLQPTPTPALPTASPSPLPTATPTYTPVPLPTPGPPQVAEDSPFTNLRLAHNISSENEPQDVGTAFAPGPQPVYLFFDYANIEAGTPWTHRWTWADTELDVFQDTWSENFAEQGTAWVYYNPAGGYQPGPYKVTLEVEGRTVATATFIVQAGGL